MIRRTLILLVAMAALTAANEASASNIFLPTSGPSCLDRSKDSFGLWRCPGPAGYVVEFGDEGNMVGMGFAKAPLRGRSTRFVANWRGAGKVFGDKLQWVMQDGKPGAAVIRVWRVDTDKDGHDHEFQELKVFRVHEKGSCEYAAIDVRQPSANEQAEARAREALTHVCPKS